MSATIVHEGLPEGIRRIDLLSLVEDLGKREDQRAIGTPFVG